MVSVMAEHSNRTSFDGADPSGQALPPGRPLYVRRAHWVARIAFSLMLILYLVAAVGVVSTFTARPLGGREAVGFFLLLVFPVMVGTNLRTWAIYGSVHGLEVVRWGARRTVPWSKVGAAEYAWWSLNYAARVARLTLHEENDRTILFFANDRILAEMETMRALYRGG